MAPRKSAAAGEVDGPMLTLIIEKGPLSGQRNEFRPGSKVHIGRVVRGNTLSIKDAGISSKHLLIQCDTALGWAITDLGSSNGTFLNGAQLDPSEPVALSGGDVVKIGEQTSIRVSFEVIGSENEVGSGNVRRNARRRVRQQDADLVVIEEDAELGLRNDEEEKIGKAAEKIEVKQGRNVSTRGTRNSAKNENVTRDLNSADDKDLEVSVIRGSVGVSTRRTRNAIKQDKVNEIEADLSVIEDKKPRRGGRGRKKPDLETVSLETEKEEPNPVHKPGEDEKERLTAGVDEVGIELKSYGRQGNLSVIEDKKTRRGGKGRKKQDEIICEEREKDEPNLDHRPGEEEKERSKVGDDKSGGTEGTAAQITSSSVPDLEERVVEIGSDLIEIEGKQKRRGGRGRKKQDVETIFEETEKEEPNPDKETREEEKEKSTVAVDESGIELKSYVTEGFTALVPSSSGVKEPNVETDKGKMVPDLEKMSLGEWLDFLDVHEPQEIIDRTEEMLAEMRRRAERCHEFRLQHKNAKGKGVVS